MNPLLESLENRQLLSAGQLDPTFFNGGIASGSGVSADESIVLPDGRILVLGQDLYEHDGPVVSRYTAKGRVDQTFGLFGSTASLGVPDLNDLDLGVQSDGRILMLVGTGDGTKLGVARFEQSGELDTTFGSSSGIAWLNGAGRGGAQSLAIASNNKILIGSTAGNDFLITRLNANGSRDTSFASATASRKIDFGGATPSSDHLAGISIQPDGKIVAAGITTLADHRSGFAAARLNSNGSFDTTFHGGHVYQVDSSFTPFFDRAPRLGPTTSAVMTLSQSGSIQIIATNKKDSSFDLHGVRFTSSGALDKTFGTSGLLTIAQPIDLHDAELQADGKMVIAGGHIDFADPDQGVFASAAVLRLTTTGAPDSTFQLDSRIISNEVTGLSIQPDQKLILSSYRIRYETGSEPIIARLLPDITPAPPRAGKADTSFGNLGIMNGRWGFAAGDPIVLSTGKILIPANLNPQGSYITAAVARLNSNGTLDTTFGNRGISPSIMSFETDLLVHDMAVQGDGKIVLALGTASSTTRLARFNANGTIDTAFGGNLRKDNSIPVTGAGLSGAQSLAITSTNKILLGTSAPSTAGKYDFVISRLNADGTPDTTFASGRSIRKIDFGGAIPSDDFLGGMQLQSDGKIVAGGISNISDRGWAYSAARLNPDGSFDTTFHGGHVYALDAGLIPPPPFESSWGTMFYSSFLRSVMSLLPDGRVQIAALNDNPSAPDLRSARFTNRGSIDTTFGLSGIISTGEDLLPSDSLVQADGKMIVTGTRLGPWSPYSDWYDGGRFGVLRLTQNGAVDPTFQFDSRLISEGGTVQGIALQGDNKILLSGEFYGDGPDSARIGMMRLLNDR